MKVISEKFKCFFQSLIFFISEIKIIYFLTRFFHLDCFAHIYRIFFAKDASSFFYAPRFQLFKYIKNLYHKKQTSHSLFKNILFSFQNQIIFGSIITLIFASCNLLVPQLIKEFLDFMRQHHVNKSELISAESFIRKFFIIQILRIIFGQHAKRLFYELAIQIQSSLCQKLIRKSLTFQRERRDRIPKSEMMQYENVDMKLVFTMFKNMYLILEAPFTIIVAIILLFRESQTYGFIGIYWFVIAFLVQRQLDSRMRHCNQTKLRLIDDRSKVNYELFGKIKQAKIIHHEDIIVEKNNDLFLKQNYDHYVFYHYSTLYDISLLIFPIIVIVTISLFDMNNEKHITVEQVYVMLELLGICYNPMKSIRTIMISFHDGLHSLSRLQNFFNLPNQTVSPMIFNDVPPGQVIIKEHTICTHPINTCDFELQIKNHIELKPGSRLIVLGKKGQGKTSFLRMLLGQMKQIQGAIFINGKKASSFDSNFIRKSSILQNIVFMEERSQKQQTKRHEYKQRCRQAEILYKEFGLEIDFNTKKGINTIIDEKSLTKSQTKKISLARAFTSNPSIYFLQNPFAMMDKNIAFVIQRKLRQKQDQGKTVIMTQNALQFAKQTDYILILQNGVSTQFGTFKTLLDDKFSDLRFFFKQKGDKEEMKEPDSGRKILNKFKNRVARALSTVHNSDDSNEDDSKSSKTNEHSSPHSPYLKYRSMSLSLNFKKKKIKTHEGDGNKFWQYFKFYLKSLSWVELFFILLIITVAQFLHIFIHYYIGHLDADQQDNPYLEFQNILILEFILTMALALIIYFEGEVSSLISIIQGNILYHESITSMVKKPINWFNQQFAVKLADKFNHDYEEIFISCHNLLGIYKNAVILVITIYFVSAGRSNIFVTITFVCLVYFLLGKILRRVEHKVVKHYYDYKYEFVRIFQECLDGATTIQIYNGEDDVLIRTEKTYRKLAGYKLAESYSSYGEELFCDFTSLMLLLLAFEYGLEIKLEGNNYSTALIGTTIHLLLNVSEVLKNIVKLSINFQTFFNINLVPFLQTAYQNEESHKQKHEQDVDEFKTHFLNYTKIPNSLKENINRQAQGTKSKAVPIVEFKNVSLVDEEENVILLKDERLNFSVEESSTIYEVNEKARAKLIQALTKNFANLLGKDSQKYGTVFISGVDIKSIPDEKMPQYVDVIMSNNFFFTGSLRQNITWRKGSLSQIQQDQAIAICRQLTLDSDLKDFDQMLLDCPISFADAQVNSEFSKKIAVLRTFMRKPKIIIIKNTSSFIGQVSLIKLIAKYISNCTVLKVTGNSQEIFGLSRVIYIENWKVVQEGKLSKFENDSTTRIGKLLQDLNVQSYEYLNKAMFSPRKFKKRSARHYADSQRERSNSSDFSAI